MATPVIANAGSQVVDPDRQRLRLAAFTRPMDARPGDPASPLHQQARGGVLFLRKIKEQPALTRG